MRIRGKLLRLGEPVVERAGVTNRRAMWVHDFPAEWASGDREVEFADGSKLRVRLSDTAPTNWRAPAPVAAP
jgi:hypothetical protein